MPNRPVLAQESFAVDGAYMTAIEAVADCAKSVDVAQMHLWNAVQTARQEGVTWDEIARATGKRSRQSAQDYFGKTWSLSL
jgi:hypothetical protein